MQLRDLPSVDELAREVDDPLAVDAARRVVEEARAAIRAGAEPGDLRQHLAEELRSAREARLRRAINATGSWCTRTSGARRWHVRPSTRS